MQNGFNIDEKLQKLKEKEELDGLVLESVNAITKEQSLVEIDKSNKFKIEDMFDTNNYNARIAELSNKFDIYYSEKDNDPFDEEFLQKLGIAFILWTKDNGNYNYKTFFSRNHNISATKLAIFKNRSERFNEYFDIGIDILESKLIDEGLDKHGNIRPLQSQFVLMNKHNMAMTSKKLDNNDDEILKELGQLKKNELGNILKQLKLGKKQEKENKENLSLNATDISDSSEN